MKRIIICLLLAATSSAFAQLNEMPVYAVTSLQPAQPGQEPSKCIDHDNTTLYHSKWGQNGIPDELNFYFSSQVSSIKKIVYTPRQTQTNGIWTSVNVSYSMQNDPTNFVSIANNLSWNLDNQDKIIDLPSSIIAPYIIKFEINSGGSNFSSCAEMRFYSEDTLGVIDGIDCAIPTTGLLVNGANDIHVPIISAGSTASSFQSGQNIEKSFDGDLNTLYHSSWGNTVFPVELNYRFDGVTPIDYLKYIPRSDGGSNGNFGAVVISYNTVGNSTFQQLMTFDFDQSGLPVNVYFPNQITPLNIQISVQDGYSNFASCAEMEFYTVGGQSSPDYSSVFADNLHSVLLPGITQAHIDTISSAFYQSLAQCLYDGTYRSEYRVQSYEVYPKLATVMNELKIGKYDTYENATGIAFSSGEKAALFVENLPSGAAVYLTVKDFLSGFNGTATNYLLTNGLNVFDISNDGLGYITYFYDDDQLQDVNINIVSGQVNGYFDRFNSSDNEWPDLLSNTAYPYIDLRGQFVHLVYTKDALQTGSPFDPKALIGKYDTIVQHERMVMGLFKYNRSPKNRQLTYCEYGNGYYAGGLGVHLDLGWGVSDLTAPDQLSIWGIAHEYGHVNQIRPDLKWIGTTEVTNNIYSIWVDYHMDNGNQVYTRLEDENTSPGTGIPSITGGRVNGAIYNTMINEWALQDTTHYDVFKILVPFWQLQIYYSLAGASRNEPILSFDNPGTTSGVDYAHWYGTVAEIARTSNTSGLTNGEHALNFVKNTCDAVKENLLPFFKNAGFLTPIDVSINDYGVGQLTITQAQIDDVIAYVEAQNYEDPISPVINYASAHSVDMYRYQLPLSGITGVGATLNVNYLTVDHAEWHNSVAYETYDTNDSLIYVSISGSGDPNNQLTKVYYPANALAVYAVGYDGTRILVFPADLAVKEKQHANLTLYPNPVDASASIHLVVGDDASGTYVATVYTIDGRILFKGSGTLDHIEDQLNGKLPEFRSGTYILDMEATGEQRYRIKFVKQ